MLNQEKSLELFANDPSIETGTLNTDIIVQNNSENFNKEFLNQTQKNLTRLQEAYNSLDINFKEDKIYEGKIIEVTKESIQSKNTVILSLKVETFDELKRTQKVSINYFFNDNEWCIKNSLQKIKDLYSVFGYELNSSDLEDINSLFKSMFKFKNYWIQLRPVTRKDEKTQKTYRNYEIIGVLNENVEE